MTMRKWKALIQKDFKLTFSNKSFLVIMLMPVIFAVFYTTILPMPPGPEADMIILIMITVLGLMMLGSSSMGMSIAEEKEKKTLRSLMLSDVSGFEFLVSKMIVVTILFTLIQVVCFLIVGVSMSYLPYYILLVFMTVLSLLFISSIIGLIAPNQQAVGIYGLPVMLLTAAPMFSIMGDNPVVLTISKFLPTGPITLMLFREVDPSLVYPSWLGFGSMIVWIIIAVLAFTTYYKRKQLDN